METLTTFLENLSEGPEAAAPGCANVVACILEALAHTAFQGVHLPLENSDRVKLQRQKQGLRTSPPHCGIFVSKLLNQDAQHTQCATFTDDGADTLEAGLGDDLNCTNGYLEEHWKCSHSPWLELLTLRVDKDIEHGARLLNHS